MYCLRAALTSVVRVLLQPSPAAHDREALAATLAAMQDLIPPPALSTPRPDAGPVMPIYAETRLSSMANPMLADPRAQPHFA